jgi:co-chaperonin GroES (HSP10)
MKFRPLHDRVVVRRIDAEDKTAGGIIRPVEKANVAVTGCYE